jgi:Secretion system C-terminal sorting domain
MKTKAIIIMILCVVKGYAQNLILNGDLENHINNTSTDISNAPPWTGIYNPDYFNIDNGGVPYNLGGSQLPQSGDAYTGINLYATDPATPSMQNVRKFLIGKTQLSLVAEKIYCLSFYVSLADTINYAVNRIGAYFSPTPTNPTIASVPYLTFYQPQVMADSTVFYDNKLNWKKIEGVYTAIGGEGYITFGNFYLDTNTDTLRLGPHFPPFISAREAYYYFDNFSLEEIKPVDAGPDTVSITLGDSITLGNDSDSASTYTWYPNVNINDTSSIHPIVNPGAITTYYVQKKQCNVTTIDSITIVVNPVGINEFSNGINAMVYPNPNTGEFAIEYDFSNTIPQSVEIIELTGKIVYSQTISGQDNLEVIKTDKLQNGVYFVSIKDSFGKLIYSSKISIVK